MKGFIFGFIHKQRQQLSQFAGLFLAAEKSLKQQEMDYLRYGIASPHVRKIEQAQATTIQWYHAFQQKLHRLYERLKKLAEADDQLFYSQQQAKREQEENDYWATVDAAKQNKKRPITQNYFQRWLQKFITMLTLRIKKLHTLLYKVQRFRARVQEAKKALLKKQVDPLLHTTKQKVKAKKLTYRSPAPNSPEISLDEHIEFFFDHVAREIHSGAMTPANMNAKLWGATYEDGTMEEGALPKALARSEQTRALPAKEKETLREHFAKEIGKMTEFIDQLPQAVSKIAEFSLLDNISYLMEGCLDKQIVLLSKTKSEAVSLIEVVPTIDSTSSIFEHIQEALDQDPDPEQQKQPIMVLGQEPDFFEEVENDLGSITDEFDDYVSNQLDSIQQTNDGVLHVSQVSITLLSPPKAKNPTQTTDQRQTTTKFYPKS